MSLSITIPADAWEACALDDGDNPSTDKLHVSIEINGTSMHLEAWAATDEHPLGFGQGVADGCSQEDHDTLCGMMDVSGFQTTTINGREYILVATPHEV